MIPTALPHLIQSLSLVEIPVSSFRTLSGIWTPATLEQALKVFEMLKDAVRIQYQFLQE